VTESGARRQARERALALLYEAEAKGTDPAEVLAGLPSDPDPYAAELVAGVGQQIDTIDSLIAKYARDWALDRMPVLDLLLLRMATFELANQRDTPIAVVINEAVELAKSYSTDDSSRFVNGVLAKIAEEVRD
jgi:transcription antitermination protein NusB